FLIPIVIVIVLWQWPAIVLTTVDPNDHPVAQSMPLVPTCAVYDGSDGRYGPGVPQPDTECVSLAFAPGNNMAVNRTMDALVAEFGWEDESIMVFDSGTALNNYANSNPGVIWLGVSFAGVTDTETLPANIDYTIHYNQTILDNAYLYMTDGLDPLADEYGKVAWSGFTLYAQHAVEKAVIYEQTGTTFDPLVKGYPSRSLADEFMLPDPMTSAVLISMLLSYQIFMVAQGAVVEKKQGKLEALRVMGVRDPLYWLSWALVQMFIFTLTLIPFLLLLHLIPDCDIFGYVDVGVTFTLFFIFGLAATSLGLFVGILCPMFGQIDADLIFYDPSFIPVVLQVILFNIFPFIPLAVSLGAMYIVVFPSVTIDMNTYETIIVPPSERFTFAMLFGSDLYQYEGMACMGGGCSYDTPPVAIALVNLIVSAVLWLLLTWIVGEWMAKNGSPGRNPLQLLHRSYWSESVPGQSQDRHKRVPVPYNEATGTADRLEPLDSDVRQEMVSVLTHPSLEKAVVVAHSLDKTFRTRGKSYNKAVDGITLRIKQGQTFCLLGHNGAGKSTTIDMLTGTLKPDNPASSRLGKAWISGLSLNKHPLQIRRTLGICPQGNTTIWPSLTPMQHMWIVGMLKGIPKCLIQNMALELLGYVDLLDVKNKPAGQFSGGMLRRLCIAMAFTGCPRLVILDEPSTGLDPIARHTVWTRLDPIARHTVWTAVEAITGKRQQMPTYGRNGHLRRKWAPPPAVMLTSHDMPEAERLGDVVAIMSKGQIAALGTVMHLKAKFGTGFVISVVADAANHTSRIARAIRRSCRDMDIDYVDLAPELEGVTSDAQEEEGPRQWGEGEEGEREGEEEDDEPEPTGRGGFTEALMDLYDDPESEARANIVTLLDRSAQSLTYSVSQSTETKLPTLLSRLEARQGRGFEYIEDISCTQTSLEEVFINVGHRAMVASHAQCLANMHLPEGTDESRRIVQQREVLAWAGTDSSEQWIESTPPPSPSPQTQSATDSFSSVSDSNATTSSSTGEITTHGNKESRRERRRREQEEAEAKIDVLNPPLKRPRYARGLFAKLWAVDRTRSCGLMGIFLLPFLCLMISWLLVAHLFPFMVDLVDEYVAGYIDEAEAACQLCMLSNYVPDNLYPTEPCQGYDMLGNPYVCTLLDQYKGNVQFQEATVFGDLSPSMKRYAVPVSMTVFDGTRFPLDKLSDVSIMSKQERAEYDPWVELAQLVEAERSLLPTDLDGTPIVAAHHGSLPPAESMVIKQIAPTYSNEREHVANDLEYLLLQSEVSDIYTAAGLDDPYLPGVKGLVAQYPAAIGERYANNVTYDHYLDTFATIVGVDEPLYHDAWTLENYVMYQLRSHYTRASSDANYMEEPEAILQPLRDLYSRVPLMTLYLSDSPDSPVQQPTLQTFMPPMTGVRPYNALQLRMSWTGIEEGTAESYVAKTSETINAPPSTPRGSGLFSNPFSLPPHVSLVNDIHAKLSGAALRSATGETRDGAGITASFQPFKYTRDYSFAVLVETIALFTAVIFVSIAVLSLLPVLAYQPVMERELKLFSLLQLKGMPAYVYWITLLGYDMALCTCMTLFLYVTGHLFSIDAITRMSFLALVVVMTIMYFNLVCFAMLVSAFLPNTKVSSVLLNAFYSCTVVVTMIFFSVYDPVTLWHALIPPMLCVTLIGKMTFRGYNIVSLFESPLMPLLAIAIGVGVVYLILAVYFDAVIPKKGTLGVRRSVFYPLLSIIDIGTMLLGYIMCCGVRYRPRHRRSPVQAQGQPEYMKEAGPDAFMPVGGMPDEYSVIAARETYEASQAGDDVSPPGHPRVDQGEGEALGDTDYAQREGEREAEAEAGVVRSAQLDGVREIQPDSDCPIDQGHPDTEGMGGGEREADDEETSIMPTVFAVRGGERDHNTVWDGGFERDDFAGLAGMHSSSVDSDTQSSARSNQSVDSVTGITTADTGSPTFLVNQSVSGLSLGDMSSVSDHQASPLPGQAESQDGVAAVATDREAGRETGVETPLVEREAAQPDSADPPVSPDPSPAQPALPPIGDLYNTNVFETSVTSQPTLLASQTEASVSDSDDQRDRGRPIAISLPLLPVPCRRTNVHDVRDTVMRHNPVDIDVMDERREVATFTRDTHPLIVANMQKYYPPRFVAVRDVCFYVENNTAMALLGPNGAGKTTTIRAVTGLTAPTRGTAFVSGDNVARRPAKVQKHLGLCPQHDVYFPSLTVRQHFSLFCRIRGVQRKMENAVVESLAKFLDLYPAIDRRADALSGGMRRRLSLGIALIGSPSVLVLDEPSTGLDPMTRRSVWKTIDKAKEHRVLLLTTHNMEEADALSQKIGVMVAGQMKAIGSRFHLKARYGSGYIISVKHAANNGTTIHNRLFMINRHIVNTASQETPVTGRVVSQFTLAYGHPVSEILQELISLKAEGVAFEYGLVFSSLEGAFLNVVTSAVQETSAGTNEESDVSVPEWDRMRRGRSSGEEGSINGSSFIVDESTM
ncbi:ABC transporter A, ABCA, partial [Kipferlia bialata]